MNNKRLPEEIIKKDKDVINSNRLLYKGYSRGGLILLPLFNLEWMGEHRKRDII